MRGSGLPKRIFDAHIRYRYLGGGYLMGVPARDLTAEDLLDVLEREGVTPAAIEGSGAYEPVNLVEIEPFCGAALADGGRCWESVERWGDRCGEHGSQDNNGFENRTDSDKE